MTNDYTSQDHITDNIDELSELNEKLKTAKKQKAAADKKAKKLRKKTDAYAGIEEWLAETPIYYVGQLYRYLVQDEIGGWCMLKPSALSKMYPILKDEDAMEALPMAMEEAERTYLYCTYAFRDYDQTVNLLDSSGWLKPMDGKHHWAFDVLMKSLGSGKPENIEHIERVLTYKYEHPECWRLPCLLFFGEGGVGKNLLMDSVLYTLYNRRTVSATSDNLISTFNSLLKGMMAVCINETVVGKHDNSKLYNTLHKERIEINEKGVPQYTVDNTPLYLIGSNDWNGGALLDRSDADRRLSVMRCEKGKPFKYWIGQHLGINQQEAEKWLEDNATSIFTNPDEIAKWLNHLLTTYGGQSQPYALHGMDYAALLDVQEQTDERIAKAVFNVNEFRHIGVKDLYEGYLICCKETGNRFPMKDKSFNRRIELWLEINRPTIIKDTFKQHHYVMGDTVRDEKLRKQTEKTVWYDPAKGKPVENNRHKYFCDDDRSPAKWKLEI